MNTVTSFMDTVTFGQFLLDGITAVFALMILVLVAQFLARFIGRH